LDLITSNSLVDRTCPFHPKICSQSRPCLATPHLAESAAPPQPGWVRQEASKFGPCTLSPVPYHPPDLLVSENQSFGIDII
jgi:hypothetical protein